MTTRYPSLAAYLSRAEDSTSQIHPVYVRNFRELIKLIPLVGSWLDANTVGAIQDKALEGRLRELESACDQALKASDAESLVSQITHVNFLFFSMIATHQEIIFRDNRQILELLQTYSAIPKNTHIAFEPDPSFALVIFSGASAVGKDTLLDLLYSGTSSEHRHCEFMTKLTTRPKRPSDSRYYKFLTDKKFQTLLDKDQILFPYYKRENRYGFDKTHLFRAAAASEILFAVFTEFEMLPKAKEFLAAQGIKVVSVLLEAPEEHLIHRSWFRSFPERDVKSRINSIKRDLKFVAEHRQLIEETYDYIVYNGDDRAKLETLKEVEAIVAGL